jgi:hypothetical protein
LGNKNDGSHVERKNWTHVRGLVGYLRVDAAAELGLLNEIPELDRIFTNSLLAKRKLILKHRDGAKFTTRYDQAAHPALTSRRPPRVPGEYMPTPLRDAQEPAAAREGCRSTMHHTMNELRPGDLYRAIGILAARLKRLSLSKAAAPAKLPLTRGFTRPCIRRFI